MIWCPKCHYKTVLDHFFNDICPQCRTTISPDDEIEKDPFESAAKARTNARVGGRFDRKPFQFDQRGGSDADFLGGIKSLPTEKLGFYNKSKKPK